MPPPRSVLRVVNWRALQHYHKPNPTWVKLYPAMLENFAIASLSDSLKWAYIGLICLAARTNNEIPDNLEWIRRRINLNAKIDLEPLIEAGLIERVEVSSTNSRAALEPFYTGSRAASEGLYAQAEAEAEAESREQRKSSSSRGRRAATAAAAAISQEPHRSGHSFAECERFVTATKPHATNPGGLARHLYRTGEEDARISAWQQEALALRQAAWQREAATRDAELRQALEFSHQLIANGGPRDELEISILSATLATLQPLADEISRQEGVRTSFESEILIVCGQLSAYPGSH